VSERPQCEWFALCDNPAEGIRVHLILGDIPICTRCAELVGAPLTTVEQDRLKETA
jgi:hypothetical protein